MFCTVNGKPRIQVLDLKRNRFTYFTPRQWFFMTPRRRRRYDDLTQYAC